MNWAPVPVAETLVPPTATPEAASTTPVPVVNPGTRQDGSFAAFAASVARFTTVVEEPDIQQAVANEVEGYLTTVHEPLTTDPLVWWGNNEYRFPHLARMAQQHLGCPATSASAERVFSLAGRLYNDLRQHMSDGTLEERMWAKVNSKPNVI